MENQINIAEILKDKPRGIKLYSPIFGDVTFDKVEKDLGEYTIFVTDKGQNHQTFMADGRYNRNGVPVLFPSKEMRDWSKFAWKKGDVLVSNDGKKYIIFVEFTDDTYTSFKGKYGYEDKILSNGYEVVSTMDYQTCKVTLSYYILLIEEKLGGKLNMDSLEVEKPKWTPKPFEKCVWRENSMHIWQADFVAFINSHGVTPMGGVNIIKNIKIQVLPYNEETAKLIGTTDNWEEN